MKVCSLFLRRFATIYFLSSAARLKGRAQPDVDAIQYHRMLRLLRGPLRALTRPSPSFVASLTQQTADRANRTFSPAR